ncbi:uncharacterized protein TNCV_5117441 [Trichonephila clavipes]|nr:uncharacterized protein TNCV_5117441 [Trichonephila clavipes]
MPLKRLHTDWLKHGKYVEAQSPHVAVVSSSSCEPGSKLRDPSSNILSLLCGRGSRVVKGIREENRGSKHLVKELRYKVFSSTRTRTHDSIFVKNLELSPTVQHNGSADDFNKTIIAVSFHDVTGLKPCTDLSPNQLALGIVYGTEKTLIRKEDTTPLMRCPVFVLLTPI